MAAAYGLYTHIQSNKRRSIALLLGLFFLVYVMVYAGALLAEALNRNAPIDWLMQKAWVDLLWASPWATLGTAAAVSVSGLIAFVGIIVPHTIRLLVSTSYRAVIPLSLVAGAGFLVLTDVLARTVLSPAELPIGVVTAFFGAPFFAVVLRTSKGIR